MAGRSISQLIKLEGAEEIQRLLAGVGNVGEKAFTQVQAAVDVANSKLESVSKAVAGAESSLTKLKEAGSSAGEAFSKFGGEIGKALGHLTKLAGIGGAVTITGLAAAMISLAKSAADASDQLVRNAQATGLTVQEYAGFSRAARQAGVEHEQFVTGMRKFSGDVVESAKKEKEAIVGLAIEVGKLRFDKKEPGVFQILPVADTQKQLDAIKKIAPEIQAAFANLGKNITVDQVVTDLQRLVREGVKLAPFFEKLGLPFPTGSFLDDLKQTAEQGSTALQKLGVRTRELVNGVSQIRSSNDVLLDAADAFSKLAEGPAKVAVAAELLGRAGPQFASFLNLGKAGLQEMIKKFDQFGLRLTDTEIAIGQKMNRSLEALGGTITSVKNKIGALFEPIILKTADALRQKILENSGVMIAFGSKIRDAVIPVFEDFISLISGRDGDVKNTWLIEARDKAIEFGAAVKNAVLGIIIPAFNGLLAVLQKVADGINAVFGTKLTGGQIGIAIVVAQLLGAFTLLGTAVLALIASAKVLFAAYGLVSAGLVAIGVTGAAVFGGAVLIIGGVVAALILLAANWDTVRKAANAFFAEIQNGFPKLKQFLDVKPTDDFWSWITRQFNAEMGRLKSDVTKAIAEVKALFNFKEDDTIWSWLTRSLQKELEAIKRDIQDTVERIKSILPKPSPDAPAPQRVDRSQRGGSAAPLFGEPRGFDRLGDPPSQNIEDRRGELTGKADQIKTDATAILESIKALASDVAETIAQSFSALSEASTTAMQAVTAIFTGGADLIGTIFAGAIERVGQSIQGLTNAFGQVQSLVQSAFSTGPVDAFASSMDSVVSAIDRVIAKLNEAIAKAREFAQSGGGGGDFPGVGASPFAAGGFTGHGGRLEPAGIVHRGEFVQRAAATRYYGVPFMAALNALRIPRDLLRGFNMGGLVDGLSRSLSISALPGFAAGGLATIGPATATKHITVDLRTNEGTFTMMTDEDTAVALTRVARRSARNSTMRRVPMFDR